MIFDIYSIIGWAGGALIIIAYFLLSTKKLKSHSVIYNLFNLIGGAGLLVSTFVTQSWPSVVMNAIWAIIAFFSIFQFRSKGKQGEKK